MLPCFGSWNHKGEKLPFKAFKSITKKSFVRENIVCKFVASYTSMTWIIYSLSWCKCLQDICRYTENSSRKERS